MTPDHDEHGRINSGSRLHAIVEREAKKWLATELIPREAEYREWLKVWIVRRNAEYVRRAEHSAKMKKLRRKDVVDEVTWYWTDALWCGDLSTSECPSTFFEDTWWDHANVTPDDREQRWVIYSDVASEWVISVFDEAFKEVMPENMHHILEG